MAERQQQPTVSEKTVGQVYLSSILSQGVHQSCCGGFQHPAAMQRRRFTNVNYCSSTLQQHPISLISSPVPVLVQAPKEKGFTSFAIDFLMGGVFAAVSKTAAAPIERVKLLIYNQDEMIKARSLPKPCKGIGECFSRTIKEEGVVSLWRGIKKITRKIQI